jgi:hypothetical protein
MAHESAPFFNAVSTPVVNKVMQRSFGSNPPGTTEYKTPPINDAMRERLKWIAQQDDIAANGYPLEARCPETGKIFTARVDIMPREWELYVVSRSPYVAEDCFPMRCPIVCREKVQEPTKAIVFEATCRVCRNQGKVSCEPDEFAAELELICVKCTGRRDNSVHTLHDCKLIPADEVA